MTGLGVRSPYIVTVNKGVGDPQIDGATASVFVFEQDGSPSSSPTFVFDKNAPANGLTSLSFNIARFLKDKIEITFPQTTADPTPVNGLVKKVAVITANRPFSANVETFSYVTRGYSGYIGGVNQALPTVLLDQGKYTYLNNVGTEILPMIYGYFPSGFAWTIRYTSLITGTVTTTTLGEDVKDLLILFPSVRGTNQRVQGCKTEVLKAGVVQWTSIFKPQKECKHEVLSVNFLNRYGVWFRTFFFKANSQTLETKKQEFNFKSTPFPAYDETLGQERIMDVTGHDKITLNTGFVDESYKEIIRDMMLTTDLLINGKPAKIDNQSIKFKTNLNDGMINYTIDFTYRFNSINNIQ